MTVRDLGLVSQVFDEEKLRALRGQMAVGHVRYSTTGSSAWENAQPVWRSDRRQVALAHNGNLINAVELHSELTDAGVQFRGTSDSEIIAALLSTHPAERIEDALAEVMPRLQGAFSTVVDDEGLGGRVPRRRRPAPAVARHARRPLLRGLRELRLRHHRRRAAPRGPARARWSRSASAASRRASSWSPSARPSASSSTSTSRGPDSILEGNRTQVSRRKMGEILWREAPVEADVVIAVPDSGNAAAAGYSKASGIPRDDGLIKNRYVARTFIQPGQELRKHGLRMKFNPLREVVAGKRLVVVDDSIVRGNTTRQIVKMLRDAGAAEIHMRISAPPIRHTCHYGVDMSTTQEMVAHGRTDEEIAQRARLRLARLPLAGRRLRGDPLHPRDPLRRLLLGRLPARAHRAPRTASSRSRSSRSSAAESVRRTRPAAASASAPRRAPRTPGSRRRARRGSATGARRRGSRRCR